MDVSAKARADIVALSSALSPQPPPPPHGGPGVGGAGGATAERPLGPSPWMNHTAGRAGRSDSSGSGEGDDGSGGFSGGRRRGGAAGPGDAGGGSGGGGGGGGGSSQRRPRIAPPPEDGVYQVEGLTDNESLSTSALLERKVAALIEREQAVRETEREAEREAAAADARRAREGDRAAKVEKDLELVARRMFYAGCVGLPWLLAMMLMYFWKEYRDEEASPVIKSYYKWAFIVFVVYTVVLVGWYATFFVFKDGPLKHLSVLRPSTTYEFLEDVA
ncbi:hypothetical protein MMPV_002663 [Pyropia vietnamensis]